MNPPRTILEWIKSPYLWPHVPKLGLARVLKSDSIRIRHPGYRLSAGLSKGHGLWCALSGLRYEPELAWALGILKNDSVVFDVGANIGAYSIAIAAKCSGTATVFAFEPGTGAYERLLRNIQLNRLEGKIIALKMAASSQTGTAGWDTMGDKWNSAHITRDTSDTPGVTLVQTIRIDDLAEQHSLQRLDLIKIDAEGHETDVINGAWTSIETFRPILIYEHTVSDLAGEQEKQLLELGYRFYTLRGGTLIPYSSDNPLESPNIIALAGSASR